MKRDNPRDHEIFALINEENERQAATIELIASENFVSNAVMEAQGSVLTNKYAEGYPGKRYYGGCEIVDKIETLAIERAKTIFGAEYVNVQPHSGTQANMAVYSAFLQLGDKVLAMDLSHGGHISHGLPVSSSGKLYNFVHYGVNQETGMIDYDEVFKIAEATQPRMIVAGASAYTRAIDFEKFREIADKVGAFLFVDMAHIAGLVATGHHMNPVPYADVVTTTTHKTLRGPRGGLILAKDMTYSKKLNSAIFPGSQGGPLEHVIAAKAVAFGEILNSDFKEYSMQIIKNAKVMEETFRSNNIKMISDGTDNHMILINTSVLGLTGQDAEKLLEGFGITVNKNTIPFDTLGPVKTSGIRIGVPAITTRGFVEEDCAQVAMMISTILKNPLNIWEAQAIKNQVTQLTKENSLTYYL